MNTLNNLLADLFPQLFNFVFFLVLLRFYLFAGIIIVLFLAKRVGQNYTSHVTNTDHRISPYNTTEVNFNKLLTGFSKPFSVKEVY